MANNVVEGFTARATHTLEFLGIAGTGRRFQIRGALMFRFADGLILHEERIYDFSAMLIQIGVLKAKPARGGRRERRGPEGWKARGRLRARRREPSSLRGGFQAFTPLRRS